MTVDSRYTLLFLLFRYLIASGLAIAAVWWHVLHLVDEHRANTEATIANNLTNLGRVSMENAESAFRYANGALTLISQSYLENPKKFSLQKLSEQGGFNQEIFQQISLIDAHGTLLQSSQPQSSPEDRSDRDYFTIHSMSTDDQVFISAPAFGRARDKGFIQVSRRITLKNGDFGGVFVASIDPAYFTQFYGELILGKDGLAALFGLDGRLRALRIGNRHEYVGDESSPGLDSIKTGKNSSTLRFTSPIDGVERIQYLRKLPGYPLVVSIGVATREAFSEYEFNRKNLFTEGAVVSLLLLALAFFAAWIELARRQNLHQQRASLAQLRNITNRVPGLVFQYVLKPNGEAYFPFASDGIADIYRLRPEDVAENAACLRQRIHPDDLAQYELSLAESAQNLSPWVHGFRVRFENGDELWLSARASPQLQADGSILWNGFIADATSRKEAEDKIRQLAFYDPLTQLPNRRLFLDRLHQAMLASHRSGLEGALLFIDLDRFKQLNDTLGHHMGDLLLQQVAQRLRICVRESDTVARLGGDEFVVIIDCLSLRHDEARMQTEQIAQKIVISLNQYYDLNGHEYHSSPSVGVAFFSQHHGDSEALIRQADLAMYQAKAAGRNQVSFYSPEIEANAE